MDSIWFTVRLIAVEVLGWKLVLARLLVAGLYTAVRSWEPIARPDVLYVARPALSAREARWLDPSRNVTVPDGVP
jgi:hypothetical protein